MSTAAIPLGGRGRRRALRRVGWGLGGLPVLLLAFVVLVTASTTSLCGPSGTSASTRPSAEALSDIPGNYLQAYVKAGEKYRLDWTVIAGIGSIESDHGRLKAPGVTSGQNTNGCCAGPMQFHNGFGSGGGTWGDYGVDGNQDGKKDIYDPGDAIPSAANYLRALGAPKNWQRAIFGYNHAQWYVDDVMRRAKRYRGAAADAGGVQALNASAPAPVSAPVVRPLGRASSQMVLPAQGPRSSGFGPRSSPGGIGSTNHQGLDIAAPAGSTIVAALDGKIVTRAPTGGYGNLVCLEHRSNLFTCYAHMSAFGTQQVGQTVRQGEAIGRVGSTGNSTGPHLHFEVRKSAGGGQVDPAPYLDGAQTVTVSEPAAAAGPSCPTPAAATGSAGDVTAAVNPWMGKTWAEALGAGMKGLGWPDGTPWCQVFVQNVLERLGIDRPTPNSGHSQDPYQWATTKDWGTLLHGPGKPASSSLELAPGDIISYGPPYGASAHVNMVEKVDERGIITVGGNQSCPKGRCVTRRGPVRLTGSGGSLRWSSGDTRPIWSIVRPPGPKGLAT